MFCRIQFAWVKNQFWDGKIFSPLSHIIMESNNQDDRDSALSPVHSCEAQSVSHKVRDGPELLSFLGSQIFAKLKM
jgi:hypothetical protein